MQTEQRGEEHIRLDIESHSVIDEEMWDRIWIEAKQVMRERGIDPSASRGILVSNDGIYLKVQKGDN